VDKRAATARSHVESAGGGAEKYGGCLTGGVNSGQVSGARRLLIFIMEMEGPRRGMVNDFVDSMESDGEMFDGDALPCSVEVRRHMPGQQWHNLVN